MLLFRIEHKTQLSKGQSTFRCGPYGNGGAGRVAPLTTPGKHPLWQDETGDDPRDYWFFGFRNKTQLKRWFNREARVQMHAAGYVCRVYEGLGMSTDHQAVLTRQAREVRMLTSKEWVE